MDSRFDGDTASANIAYSDEAIEEINEALQSPQMYIGADGKFINSIATSTVSLVLFNMTGDPE